MCYNHFKFYNKYYIINQNNNNYCIFYKSYY